MGKFGKKSLIQKCVGIDKVFKPMFKFVKSLYKENLIESGDWIKVEFYAHKTNKKLFHIDEFKVTQDPKFNEGKVGYSNEDLKEI